jgi:hypothetical protein
MKTDLDQAKDLSYCETVALAMLRLKQQLQIEYERAHPELREIIPAILDEEEKNAWDLSSFPHLLVPDLVEERMAKSIRKRRMHQPNSVRWDCAERNFSEMSA